MQKVLSKKKLEKFINNLIGKYEVTAPVKEGATKFKEIKNYEEVFLDHITQIPVKSFFMPEEEVLLEFKKNKIIQDESEIKKRIIFGIRKCDLAALKVLDKVMPDPNYIRKRQNTILIGLHCENPDEYCFCNSMEMEAEYDLFFYPEKDKYYISIGSEKGRSLVKNLPDAKKEVIKEIKNFKKIKNKDIEKDYKNKIWETDANKCLSCGACTVYCPTCNCFDIHDKLDINLKDGIRRKSSASCQLKSFSKVAGGKVFRDSRLSRFKHFVYHKIVYFKKRHDMYMCVGCGRCLRVCPTKIDWTNTINLLSDSEVMK